jgi:ankyrin repeat protein
MGACGSGNLEIVDLLPFDWPTYPGSPKKGDTPLFVAVAQSDAEAIAPENELPAKRAERLAIVDLLLEAGTDVNAQRGGKASGWTPLMMAIAQDDDEIVARLLSAGADPKKEVLLADMWKSVKSGNVVKDR